MQLTHKIKIMATPEEEPRLKLTLSSGGEFYATRDNTTLFQFFGRLAIYDHVFIETGMEDSTPTGIYLFQNQDIWRDLVDYIVTNEFPQHVALREVAQCDIDAFDRTMFDDVRHMDSFPSEWAETQ
jgi:hypothetical protein